MAVTVLVSGACSSSTGSDWADQAASAPSGLLGALGKVAATAEDKNYVEYGDLAKVRELVRKDKERFLNVAGYGYGQLSATSVLMAEQLGFDPQAMDQAVTAGTPPKWAGVFWGKYDVAKLDRELAGRDITSSKSGGATLWTSAGDNELSIDGPLGEIAPTGQLNNIRTADGSLAYAPTKAGIDWVTNPGGGTLADDAGLRKLAGCLGDATAAIMSRPDGDSTAYAVGVRAPSADDVTEVVCLAPSGDANGLRDRVERELSDGSARSGQPWTEVLPGAKADVVDGVVRIQSTPAANGPVGLVMRLLVSNDLAVLAG
ncbi:hypothetical protein [Actinophytocola sp.]|uniref:hypothetical protein n=1 Tax=Actinophytocola sp. TaxID=1872138 RepID=UPI002ED79819